VAVVQYRFTHKTVHRTTQLNWKECGACPTVSDRAPSTAGRAPLLRVVPLCCESCPV